MVEINVYNEIGKSDIWARMLGMDDQYVFSSDLVKRILKDNEKESDIKFNINCDGGSVSEGLAIYDILRNSGKTLYTNIEGGCHSMAVCILLAAPEKNRTANPNCRALIHRVYAFPYEQMNADDARSLADDMEREEEAILDIYTSRTGTKRSTLKNLMADEKELTAKQLLEYGFISKINKYNTNLKREVMTKPTQKTGTTNKKAPGEKLDGMLNRLSEITNKIGKVLSFRNELTNYAYTDSEGNTLFFTEGESDDLAAGSVVTFPDGEEGASGEYVLGDGRIVEIIQDEEGNFVVESVREAENDDDFENMTREQLINRCRDLTDTMNSTSEAVVELTNEVTDLKNMIGSGYVPEKRNSNPTRRLNVPKKEKTVEELKNEAREARAKFKGEKPKN